MKNFAVRVWDSKLKRMVVITDITFDTFYKLHTGEPKENPMIASSFYDSKGERLFENDIILVHWSNWDAISIVELDKGGWVAHEVTEGHSESMLRVDYNTKYEKVGDVFSNNEVIQTEIDEYNKREEAKTRHKELECLAKLKAKYEGED